MNQIYCERVNKQTINLIKGYFIDVPSTKQIKCICCQEILIRRHTTENIKHLITCQEFGKQQPEYQQQLICHSLTCESMWRTSSEKRKRQRLVERLSLVTSGSNQTTSSNQPNIPLGQTIPLRLEQQNIPFALHQQMFPLTLQQPNTFQRFNQETIPLGFNQQTIPLGLEQPQLQTQSQSLQFVGNNQESDQSSDESYHNNNNSLGLNQQNFTLNQTIPLRLQQPSISLGLNQTQPQQIIVNVQESDQNSSSNNNIKHISPEIYEQINQKLFLWIEYSQIPEVLWNAINSSEFHEFLLEVQPNLDLNQIKFNLLQYSTFSQNISKRIKNL